MSKFKSPTEYAWHAWLNAVGVEHRYEALESDAARALRYQPDFWLGEALAWLEIKPVGHKPTEGEERVAAELARADNAPVYITCGWPQATDLELVVLHPFGGRNEWSGWQALHQLSLVLDKRPVLLEAASAAVMARRREFVARWEVSSAIVEGDFTDV